MEVAIRCGRIEGGLRPPGSKSIAQRALLLAARRGGSVLNVPESDDIDRLCGGLRALGFEVVEEPGERKITGSFSEEDARIDCGDNGTAARCLLAMAALRKATTVIDGSSRLRERPFAPLCEALRKLGATVDGNALPVQVTGPLEGREIVISAELSSQFASALILLVAWVRRLRVKVTGRASLSYVGLTAHVQRHFARPYTVEPDFSSAAPFAFAAAVTGGDLLLEGIGFSSPQPDARFVPFLNRAGARVTEEEGGIRVRGGESLRGLRADLRLCPDLAPLMGVLGVLAEGETLVSGAPHLRLKESDRIGATADLVRKVGGVVEPREDGFHVRGGRAPGSLVGGRLSSHGDHRIAMAAAVLGLRIPGITVTGAQAVGKSYPGFFDDLDSLTV